MPGNFLDQLTINPHGWRYGPATATAAGITYDEYGQPYDVQGRKIPPPADPSVAQSLLNIAESPARMATAFIGALSPYGSEGWRVPPAFNEPINAYLRLAQNSRFEDGRLGIPNPGDIENQNDTRTILGTMIGGNATRGMASEARALPSLAESAGGSTSMFGARDQLQAAYRSARHPFERSAVDDQATLDHWREVAQLQQYIRDKNGYRDAMDYVVGRLPEEPYAPYVFNDEGLASISAYEKAALNQMLQRRAASAPSDGLAGLRPYRHGGYVPPQTT